MTAAHRAFHNEREHWEAYCDPNHAAYIADPAERACVWHTELGMRFNVDRGDDSIKYPVTYMPYRCMIPRKVNNLLVACRAFSSDQIANNFFNYIPHCIALGEAAGIAAAQSAGSGVDLRKIDIRTLKANLRKQGAILPG